MSSSDRSDRPRGRDSSHHPDPAGGHPTTTTGRRSGIGDAGVVALALVVALAVGAVFIVSTNQATLGAWGRFFEDPWEAISWSAQLVAQSYLALLTGAVGSTHALSETLTFASPLVFAGLAVAFAFRGGLFNIGASGQILIGSAFAAYVGFTFQLAAPFHVAIALGAGFLGGALWGGIAGVLKANPGAHEVITTIMLNFVALRLVDWVLTTSAFVPPGQTNPVSKEVHASARLPKFSADMRGNASIVVALLVVLATWWVLERTTFGFQVRAIGFNQVAARYAGMRTGLLLAATMAIAGGLAGLAGSSVVLGITPRLTSGLSSTGYDAIAVAILGRSKPAGVLFAALLFGGLQAGALNMQAETGVRSDIVAIIQALVVVCVAAPELVRMIFRMRTATTGGPAFTAGWGR